jgi:hypothetical protein
VKVGRFRYVMLSEVDRPAVSPGLDVPPSAIISGVVGVAVAVSMVTASAVDGPLTFPAASVTLVVSEWMPSARVDDVIDHVPVVLVGGAPAVFVPLVVAVPSTVVPFVS